MFVMCSFLSESVGTCPPSVNRQTIWHSWTLCLGLTPKYPPNISQIYTCLSGQNAECAMPFHQKRVCSRFKNMQKQRTWTNIENAFSRPNWKWFCQTTHVLMLQKQLTFLSPTFDSCAKRGARRRFGSADLISPGFGPGFGPVSGFFTSRLIHILGYPGHFRHLKTDFDVYTVYTPPWLGKSYVILCNKETMRHLAIFLKKATQIWCVYTYIMCIYIYVIINIYIYTHVSSHISLSLSLSLSLSHFAP